MSPLWCLQQGLPFSNATSASQPRPNSQSLTKLGKYAKYDMNGDGEVTSEELVAMTFQNLFPGSFEQVLVVRNHKVSSQWVLSYQSVTRLQGVCTVLTWGSRGDGEAWPPRLCTQSPHYRMAGVPTTWQAQPQQCFQVLLVAWLACWRLLHPYLSLKHSHSRTALKVIFQSRAGVQARHLGRPTAK